MLAKGDHVVMCRTVSHLCPCQNARSGGEGDRHEKGNRCGAAGYVEFLEVRKGYRRMRNFALCCERTECKVDIFE